MDQKPFAIIAGVGKQRRHIQLFVLVIWLFEGAGTGGSLAKRFAKQYPVALLARSTKFASELASQIEDDGGTAVSYQVDVSDEKSMEVTFNEIRKQFGTNCAAALFNASSRPFPKPFLWQSESDLSHALGITLYVKLAKENYAELLTNNDGVGPGHSYSLKPHCRSFCLPKETQTMFPHSSLPVPQLPWKQMLGCSHLPLLSMHWEHWHKISHLSSDRKGCMFLMW